MKFLDVPQSGSVAGQTSSRNRYGQYRRTRAIPVNPNTARQAFVRGALQDASVAWRGLSDAIRDSWRSYALANPSVDSLGQSITLTGFQWLVSQWLSLVNAGLAAPPEVPSTPSLDAPSVTEFQISSELGETIQMVFISDAVVSATRILVVEASPPVSAGVNFQADYRFVKAFNVVLVAGVVDFLAAYVAKFGFAVSGSRVFIRARMVDATSRPSGATLASAVGFEA